MIILNKYIKYLSDKTKNEPFVDRLKIKFRPLIFPIELLLSYIDKNDVIFDIGCGSGQFALLAVYFKKIKKIYGVEISDALIKNANDLFKKHTIDVAYNFTKFNGKELPKNINLCNKIFLNDVLHHIPQKNQILFLKEIFNNIDENAIFILKDIDASSLLVYFNKLHDIVFAGEVGNELKFTEAIRILKEIGFKIIDTDKRNIAVYPHYTIVCKK
ncbi:MAG: class I SAM-dependent methyltransferase [Flavobacteriaceae bacterium]|nr:class I SAM-dependent methyltransferase [Flavobacteriaceae bacterium]